MKITRITESNTLTICGLCEEPKLMAYEINDNNKILCLCTECLNKLSNEIIRLYEAKRDDRKVRNK